MKPVYLITGDDEPSIEDRARKLVLQLAGPEADDFTLEVIKESPDQNAEQTIKSLLEAVHTPSFLGAQKTICLHNFSAFSDEPAKSKKDKQLNTVGRCLRQLADFIENEFPPDISLILSGPAIDKRKRLYKICSELGKVEEHKKPDLKDRRWRDKVAALINGQAKERGMTLDRRSVEYLLEVIGVDTGRIGMEMEKLFCYAGAEPALEQIREVCTGSRDAYFFALADALGRRHLDDALEALAQTMAHARNEDSECIRLIRMTANYFRKLLHAKIAAAVLKTKDGRGLAGAVKRMSESQAERLAGNQVLSMGDWQLRNTGELIGNYRGHELQAAIARFGAADRSMVSSSLPKRLVLETLIVSIIGGHAA